MKYLEIQKLAEISQFLTNLCNGDQVLNGSIEAFSCKASGDEKKFAKRLQKQLSASVVGNGNDEKRLTKEASDSKGNDSETGKKELPDAMKPTVLRSRSVSFAQSGAYNVPGQELAALGAKPASIGPLADPSVRKRVINLIATMNATFQDYDFSNVKPERFVRHQSYKDIMPIINKNFAEVVEIHNRGFLKILWDALDDAMNVRECEVFSYLVDDDDPKAVTGDLWSINYFFFNPSMNRMAYLKCVANSKFRRRYDDIVEDDDSDFDDYEMDEDFGSSQQFYQVTEVVDDDDLMENGY